MLPPEPHMVRWFFENRAKASFDKGFTAEQLAANERLWAILCHGQDPAGGDGPPEGAGGP